MSNNLQVFTGENFTSEVLESKSPVLVDFWAPWCSPCRAVLPAVEKIADEFADAVSVGKLNIDTDPDVARQFGVQSIPTFIVFKEGKPVSHSVGALSKDKLTKLLNDVV